MNKKEAKEIINSTFSNNFDEQRYKKFASNLFKTYKPGDRIVSSRYIKQAYKAFVVKYKIVGTFEDKEGYKIDILEVNLKKSSTLERARTAQRNFIADYLKVKNKDAALVAFISPNNKEWRLSLVKMESSLEVVNEELEATEEITPAKRWSFLVGKNEGSHTAQSRFVDMLMSDEDPSLTDLEVAFDIETVTKEFFEKYKELYFRLKEYLDSLIAKDKTIRKDFKEKGITTVDFAKKTLGQIVFLYFLQKKGWFGVAPDEQWGEGTKKFLRKVFERREEYGDNFFNDILEPIFYKALAQDRGTKSIYPDLNNCRMPFLNGGLFEPMNGYLWETININIPDELFSNSYKDEKTGDIGDGILDVLDRYNFTVNEDEPLEKEVAVDPEMLGKVFENLLDIKDRKSKGAFYTPREIVHYMCQESLINYLYTKINNKIPYCDLELFIRNGDRIIENDMIALARQEKNIEKYGREYTDKSYSLLLPVAVRTRAVKLDSFLKNIKVVDPAVGSGAFALGMINEIVRARKVLNVYLKKDISDGEFKKHAVIHSIYGVDIDPGAVEITKLRLWLALVVDEEIPHPLPNLEYKIMQGDSLISEYEGVKLFDEDILTKREQEATQSVLGLGFRKKESDLKMKTLRDKVISFINESEHGKKQNLKKEIDILKWEFIEETLKEQGREDKLGEIKKLRQKNIRPFFIWKLEFSDVFKDEGGFDVVIGNPPYVQLQKEGGRLAKMYKDQGYKTFARRGDVYSLFYERGWQLLKENGSLCFITSNKWMRAGYGSKTRKFFAENTNPILLVDFTGQKIFKSATVDTNILLFLKSKNQGKTKSVVIKENVLNKMGDFIRQNANICSFTTSNNWVILNEMEQRIKAKIEAVGIPLKEWNININYGIKTGLNEAFIINNEKRKELIKQDPKSAEIIRPILRGRDIKRYGYKFAGLYIILAYFGSHKIIPKEYPAIYQHLKRHKVKLKNRGQARYTSSRKPSPNINYPGQHHWLELDNNPSDKYLNQFKKEKIIYSETNNANETKITFDNKQYFTDKTAFIIVGENIKHIYKLLSSNIFTWYMNLISPKLGVNGISLTKESVEAFPCPPISSLKIEEAYKLTKEEVAFIENQ